MFLTNINPKIKCNCHSIYTCWRYYPCLQMGALLRANACAGSSVKGTGTYTHLVSAWASVNILLLAQDKVAGKSNEIRHTETSAYSVTMKLHSYRIRHGLSEGDCRDGYRARRRLYPCIERQSFRNARQGQRLFHIY